MSLATISKKRVLISNGSDDQSGEDKKNDPVEKPVEQNSDRQNGGEAYRPTRDSYHTVTGRLKRLFL